MDMIEEIYALLDGIDPVPNVAIDPTAFREAGAILVPLLVARGPDGELARVTGLSAPAWLRDRIQWGARGDLGVRGPAVAIGEVDLIEELQRRAAALDMDALREGAIKRFWQRATFDSLPVVTEPRERTIDPTIVASADVVLPDGSKAIAAGQTVNPLDHVPFSHRLIVFDASDPRQVETARRLGETDSPQRPLYLATAFDRVRAGTVCARSRTDSTSRSISSRPTCAPALLWSGSPRWSKPGDACSWCMRSDHDSQPSKPPI